MLDRPGMPSLCFPEEKRFTYLVQCQGADVETGANFGLEFCANAYVLSLLHYFPVELICRLAVLG